METLEIEDLKILLSVIDGDITERPKANNFFDYESYNYALTEWIKESPKKIASLKKSRAIIEQMIKDIEFEQSRNPLPY